MRTSKSVQPSLWPGDPGQWEVLPQLSERVKEPRTKRRVQPQLETSPLTLWQKGPEAKPQTITELQEFAANFQYQPRPVPVQSLQCHTARLDKYASGYEIMCTNPACNLWSAHEIHVQAIVSLSGGLGSAIAAERAIQKHGRENVLLWFADVKDENEDLYRFLHDLMKRWGGRLFWYTDGRRPADVWTEHLSLFLWFCRLVEPMFCREAQPIELDISGVSLHFLAGAW